MEIIVWLSNSVNENLVRFPLDSGRYMLKIPLKIWFGFGLFCEVEPNLTEPGRIGPFFPVARFVRTLTACTRWFGLVWSGFGFLYPSAGCAGRGKGEMKMLRSRYIRPAVAAAARSFSAAPLVDELASSATLSAGAPAGSSSSKERSGGNTLGKQLLSLVYAKRSAVVTIRQWKERGNQVRKYELNRIVRELRKLKRYKHALEVSSFSLSVCRRSRLL